MSTSILVYSLLYTRLSYSVYEYIVYCILYNVYSILYTVYSILNIVYLWAVYCIQVDGIRNTVYMYTVLQSIVYNMGLRKRSLGPIRDSFSVVTNTC